MADVTFGFTSGNVTVRYYVDNKNVYVSSTRTFTHDASTDLNVYVIPYSDSKEFVLKENNSTYYIQTDFVAKYFNGSTVETGRSEIVGMYAGWDSSFTDEGQSGAYRFTIPASALSSYSTTSTYYLDPKGFRVQNKTVTSTVNVTYSLTHCTVNPQPTTVTQGVAATFTFTPDTGYQFDTQPEAYYQSHDTGSWIHTSATDGVLTITSDSDIEITATATAIPQPSTYSVTYNLTNCSVSPSPDTITENTSYTLTFSPNDGYQFETQPYITMGSSTISASDGAITFTASGDVVVYASAVEIPAVTYTVTNNLTNATVSPVLSSVTEGQQYTLTFAPDSGYQFDVQPYVVIAGTRTTATNNSLTFTATADVSVYAIAVETPKPTYPVTYNLTNASVSPSPTTVTQGEAYTFTFTPNEGYLFEEQAKAQWQDTAGAWHTSSATNNVLSITFTDVNDGIEISGTAIKQTIITDNYGIIRLYNVTADNMKALANFDKDNIDTPDLTQYIASLRRFFTPIESAATVTLRLGGYDTSISVGQIADDIIIVDCGTVHVSGYHSNALDYTNTTVEFWLPFVGVVTVETERVMDSDVSLKYQTNTMDGECVAILSVNNIPIAHASGNMSYEIPYNINDYYSVSSNLTMAPYYLLNLTPSVVIRENQMTTNEKITDSRWVKIGDMNGFIALDDCSISGIEATITEINMIANYIENGIIV